MEVRVTVTVEQDVVRHMSMAGLVLVQVVWLDYFVRGHFPLESGVRLHNTDLPLFHDTWLT